MGILVEFDAKHNGFKVNSDEKVLLDEESLIPVLRYEGLGPEGIWNVIKSARSGDIVIINS